MKGEMIATYSSRIAELVNELLSAGWAISDIEKKRAFLHGLMKEFDFTVEAIMVGNYSYGEAVSKLIVRETHVKQTENSA